MKLLISVAFWGREYRETFLNYSLASQLAENNLPTLAKEHRVVYHIMTTRRDGRWLRSRPAVTELAKYCEIDWDFIEDHGYNSFVLPVGPEGSKYLFLSLLQNIAIAKSLDFDALIFNYADFVWADRSLPNSVAMLTDDVDAVLGFCLPVDKRTGIQELDRCRRRLPAGGTVVELPPRTAADIAIRKMHREARLRYWDGPAFTITPTYLLWPVDKEGAIIRAYHQTILVLRVKPDDPAYRDGIPGGSLDGYFTTLLAERSKTRHATNSDDVMVFSLYDTIVDSRIGGASRSSPEAWRGYGREESLRECLRAVVSEGQRKFALIPIEVRRSYDDSAHWRRVAEESEEVVRSFHATTPFEAEEYKRIHTLNVDIEELAKRWRTETSVTILATIFYQQILLKGVLGHLGPALKRLLGAERARALRERAELFVYGTNPVKRPTAPETLVDPFRQATPFATSPSLVDGFRRLERALSRDGLLTAMARELRPALVPLFSGPGEWLLGAERSHMLRNAITNYSTPGFTIAPGIDISGKTVALFIRGSAFEARMPKVTSLSELDTALDASEALLREAVAAAPGWPEAHRVLGRNLWFQGRFRDAIHEFTLAERAAARDMKAVGWDPTSGAILPDNCTAVVGLTGHIDAFVKNKILTGDERPYYLLVGPTTPVANREFLDYWADFITIVTDPATFDRLSPLQPLYSVNWNWVLPEEDGSFVHVHTGIARIQHRWEYEGREPLLKLKTQHAALLTHRRREWGMKPTDWFVCLHARSHGFYSEEIGGAQHFRNTPIEDYYEMIRFITGAGGWVVRMGDPSMPPLDLAQCGSRSDRVIDYAHCWARSQELDVALCATCRLFVSGPSGLHTVAHAFGRPVCPVNFPIYAGFPWHRGEVFIPQRYFSRALGRVETLEEIFANDHVYADHQFLLERADIELIQNSPEEIVEAVREALDPKSYTLPGPALDTDVGRQVQSRFRELNQQYRMNSEASIGLYFAAKHAHELCPDIAGAIRPGPARDGALEAAAATRRLDVVIPSFNRPARLHHLLTTGLALQIPGMSFVVIDDGSTVAEEVPGFGRATTAQVCASFGSKRIIYIRNKANIGVAKSWARYYRDFCTASYTMSVTDKDEFIDRHPIVSALEKLDADPAVSMAVIPLRQKDRDTNDREISFNYRRMSGKEYLAHYVEDNPLQHCSMWGIMRLEAIRKAGVPRSMELREYGLDDGFGIDIDFVFMVAATGDVEFETRPHVRRSTLAGGTEKYPLTFAYTYYQYAKKAMYELAGRSVVTQKTVRQYIRWWLLLICRGLVVAYRPVHGSELEQGTTRVGRHLPMPILLYLPFECIRHRIAPTREMVQAYCSAALLMARGVLERRETQQPLALRK